MARFDKAKNEVTFTNEEARHLMQRLSKLLKEFPEAEPRLTLSPETYKVQVLASPVTPF